ncbi:MAG: transcriptional regulator GcvA [Pseudomonadota bacterium]
MRDRLPPLTALRAFEAAARHMSFARAAAELHVTPAALSFQIKSLEEHLGQPVFRRLNRAVELTEAGRVLAPGAADAFATLAAAWRAARRLGDTTSLTVTAGPAFTAVWLASRLYDFAQAHPRIELRFSASVRMMDFERDDIDVAIRFGYGPDRGLHSEPLMREWMTPMMAPELIGKYGTLAAMRTAPLLNDDSMRFLEPPCDWDAWFRLNGIDRTDWHGPHFSQADHAIDAALSGGGILLGRVTLTSKALNEGRLIAPFAKALATDANFRFLCRKGAVNRPQIKAFRDWIMAETEQSLYPRDGREIIPAGDIPA